MVIYYRLYKRFIYAKSFTSERLDIVETVGKLCTLGNKLVMKCFLMWLKDLISFVP